MRLHNRQIRAGFWTDDTLLQWPREQRWLYAGLVQLADDSGCLERSAFALKIHLFPSPLDGDITAEVIDGWIDALIAAGKLLPYAVAGKRCLFLTRFHDYQVLDNPAAPGRESVPLPAWITFVKGEKNRRGARYVVDLPGQRGDASPALPPVVQDVSRTCPGQTADVSGLEPEPEPEPEPPTGFTTSAVGTLPALADADGAQSPEEDAVGGDDDADPEALLHRALRGETRYPTLRAVCLLLAEVHPAPVFPSSVGWDHTRHFAQQEGRLSTMVAHCAAFGVTDWQGWLSTFLSSGKLAGAFEDARQRSDLQVWPSVFNELAFACRLAAEKAAKARSPSPPGGGPAVRDAATVALDAV